MNREELEVAIERTLDEIMQIKKEIDETDDLPKRKRLIQRKKELQYLQLWHIDQLESLKESCD